MVSVCLLSDALLQHLPSYLGFSYLGRGVSLHGCSSKAQPLLLTLNEGYLLTTALPDPKEGTNGLPYPLFQIWDIWGKETGGAWKKWAVKHQKWSQTLCYNLFLIFDWWLKCAMFRLIEFDLHFFFHLSDRQNFIYLFIYFYINVFILIGG